MVRRLSSEVGHDYSAFEKGVSHQYPNGPIHT